MRKMRKESPGKTVKPVVYYNLCVALLQNWACLSKEELIWNCLIHTISATVLPSARLQQALLFFSRLPASQLAVLRLPSADLPGRDAGRAV